MIYYKNEKGEFHRVDGPAIEYSNGAKEWYLNGKLHRVDGPAIERPDGTREWYLNGKFHREEAVMSGLDRSASVCDYCGNELLDGMHHTGGYSDDEPLFSSDSPCPKSNLMAVKLWIHGNPLDILEKLQELGVVSGFSYYRDGNKDACLTWGRG